MVNTERACSACTEACEFDPETAEAHQVHQAEGDDRMGKSTGPVETREAQTREAQTPAQARPGRAAPRINPQWQRWVIRRATEEGYALPDPERERGRDGRDGRDGETGEVRLPYIARLAERSGLSKERLYAYVNRGEMPSERGAMALAEAFGDNPMTGLYHAGYIGLDHFRPLLSAEQVDLMTPEEYAEEKAYIETEYPPQHRAQSLRLLERAYAYSRWLYGTLHDLGLSEHEIAGFLRELNDPQARQALHAGITGGGREGAGGSPRRRRGTVSQRQALPREFVASAGPGPNPGSNPARPSQAPSQADGEPNAGRIPPVQERRASRTRPLSARRAPKTNRETTQF